MREPWQERVLPNDEAEYRFGVRPAPCPFCGNPNAGLYLGPIPHVHCGAMDCGADGPEVKCRSRDELPEKQRLAILLWNNRR